MRGRSLGALAVVAAITACGGAGQAKAPRPTVTATPRAEPAGIAVIRGWSQALARGDIAAASAFFTTPSQVQLDPNQPVSTARSAADIGAVNRLLPCGAKLLAVRPVRGYLDALFLLTTRPGASCNGVGATARVAFVIAGGKITVWRRIPDEPGDAARGTPGAQPPPPTARAV
ncbi:MAG: hypothetical protein ACR2KV_07390 [Solirubrobacteraceae bacterium]